jgi:hypothetical protein
MTDNPQEFLDAWCINVGALRYFGILTFTDKPERMIAPSGALYVSTACLVAEAMDESDA